MRPLAARLRDEAERANERRLLVLSGDPSATRSRAVDALEAADIPPTAATYLGPAGDDIPAEHVDPTRSDRLLGTTRTAIVLDCHEACRPNALGRVTGAVDGGGLLILLTPPLATWPNRRDAFDETLAVPPFPVDDVTGRFRFRLVETLRAHRGVAIVDADAGTVRRSGLTDPAPSPERAADPSPPDGHEFPDAAYAACLTDDQSRALAAFEALRSSTTAVVLEADRGRGKSSTAGLGAASLALDGRDVLVTAPDYRNAEAVFERADELLVELGEIAGRDRAQDTRRVETETGRLRFEPPTTAATLPADPDVVIVDEAAALPVGLLQQCLEADCVAFSTTIHGYEGAGRGFSVRFRDRLAASDHDVTDVWLEAPIRYAAGDPVEVWAFRALALDARPAASAVVADARPQSVKYRALEPATLLENDTLLHEAVGLLVLAHYQTEPADFARLLDAPNLTTRALLSDGHVAAIALLAREGNLDPAQRSAVYEGGRIRGNMIPDVLMSQLRDETAGAPVGQRIVRIATHHAVRSHGLGSMLLAEIRAEFEDDVDWLGAGFGATPDLLSFWQTNGFHAVHLSTTRNDASGEHSAIMLDPCSQSGEALCRRHTDWFCRRLLTMLTDPLAAVDPDVVRGTLRSVDATPSLDLTEIEWRHVAGIPYGAAIFDTAPRPSRQVALRHLVDPVDADLLTGRQERLLVAKVLQARPWSAVADRLSYASSAACKRAFGTAIEALLSVYGNDRADVERSRLE